MRSDPPRFQKPRIPRIDEFVERLEGELREEMWRHPPRRPNPLQRFLDRWGRLVLRPVFHGSTLTVLFLVMFMLRPQPAMLLTDATLSDVHATSVMSQWVEIVQVPDPSPRFIPSVHRERAPRFVAFADTAPAPDIEPIVGRRPV